MKRLAITAGMIFALTSAGGCAWTTQPNHQISQLQMRVVQLERRLQDKENTIRQLEQKVGDLSYEIDRLKLLQRETVRLSRRSSSQETRIPSAANKKTTAGGDVLRVHVPPTTLQRALQKAGFYQGAIDGKIGPATRTAIREFQKQHGLKADGIVGRRTWKELKVYVE